MAGKHTDNTPDVALPSVATELTRDDEFWMDDGSIVLISAHRVVFRVYKGLLAAHSPVFRTLFADGTPSVKESYDSCPADLRYFLRALMHNGCPRSEDDPKISVEEVLAVARLAHKYEVDELLRQAIACLKTYYTDRFDVWDHKAQSGKIPLELSEDETPFYAIGVIALARLTDTPSMLPLAFYDCCALGGSICHGWKHEDGTIERLSPHDLERYFDGSVALANRAVRSTLQFLDTGSTMCSTSNFNFGDEISCQRALARLKEKLRSRAAVVRGDAALHSMMDIRSLAQDAAQLCQRCRTELTQHDRNTRKAIWAELPSLFDLTVEGWETTPS
ncbi:hypothetical protein C8Q80DRAFT_1222567 [Daedaleopsis nitida]|nr:hypothetical protein C8Q80DRAFT_1222567 [Daedaleopsis nitida]